MARSASAVLTGLALAGCPADSEDMGTDSNGMASSTSDGVTSSPSGSAYGVPTTDDSESETGPVETTDPGTTGSGTGASSSGTGSDTDTDTDTEGTSTGAGSTTGEGSSSSTSG